MDNVFSSSKDVSDFATEPTVEDELVFHEEVVAA